MFSLELRASPIGECADLRGALLRLSGRTPEIGLLVWGAYQEAVGDDLEWFLWSLRMLGERCAAELEISEIPTTATGKQAHPDPGA